MGEKTVGSEKWEVGSEEKQGCGAGNGHDWLDSARSVAQCHREGLGDDHIHIIFAYAAISGYQFESFNGSLGDKHAVKRIFMNIR